MPTAEPPLPTEATSPLPTDHSGETRTSAPSASKAMAVKVADPPAPTIRASLGSTLKVATAGSVGAPPQDARSSEASAHLAGSSAAATDDLGAVPTPARGLAATRLRSSTTYGSPNATSVPPSGPPVAITTSCRPSAARNVMGFA